MTASLRGLLACTALVLALALLWVLGAPPPLPSPRVWSGTPAEVRELRWRRAGRPELVVRRQGEQWQLTHPLAAPARASVVDDLLDALAAARWHRRGPTRLAGALTDTLLVDGREMAVGQALGAQRWLVAGGHALLVDGWLARLLAIDADELRDRELFAGARGAVVIEVHGAPAPWAAPELVVQAQAEVSPRRRLLDPARRRALELALSSLQLDHPLREVAAPATWSIRLGGGVRGEQLLEGGGACPGVAGAVWVRSARLGAGCVDGAALAAVAREIDALAGDAAADLRPLAAAAAEVEALVVRYPDDGRAATATLTATRTGGAWRAELRGAAGAAALVLEPAALERLLGVLTSPWPRLAPKAGRATAAAADAASVELVARLRDGAERRLRWRRGPPGWIERVGEELRLAAPADLELGPAALASALTALAPWALEPSSVNALELAGGRAVRGAVLGEWLDARGTPLAPDRATAIEALAALACGVRGLRPALVRGPPQRVLTLELAPPPSRTKTERGDLRHVLELWQRGRQCVARADGSTAAALEVPPELCAAAARAARALTGG